VSTEQLQHPWNIACLSSTIINTLRKGNNKYYDDNNNNNNYYYYYVCHKSLEAETEGFISSKYIYTHNIHGGFLAVHLFIRPASHVMN
jgi:hypothetical protein